MKNLKHKERGKV